MTIEFEGITERITTTLLVPKSDFLKWVKKALVFIKKNFNFSLTNHFINKFCSLPFNFNNETGDDGGNNKNKPEFNN